jgi:hypothetical protein
MYEEMYRAARNEYKRMFPAETQRVKERKKEFLSQSAQRRKEMIRLRERREKIV